MVFDGAALNLFPDEAVPREDRLAVGARRLPLRLVRNPRARRYLLRLAADGAARVTIPRGGSAAEAIRFAGRHTAWLERQLLRQAQQPATPRVWRPGDDFWFRGEQVRLELGAEAGTNWVSFGGDRVPLHEATADLRPIVERRLWQLATRELPPRVLELAAAHGFRIGRVSVRNQRSRWGSCSRRGTISLNWRLIQIPPSVRDYLIFHELAHLREMNHSSRFWREVERLCPDFLQAERWLKSHATLLR